MLYHLFKFLHDAYGMAGARLFQYISFRAMMAAVVSLLIAMIFGKKMILFLQRKQIGESIRELGLEGQMQKKGTPTMGGIIIILSILVPVLLFARLENVYIILLLVTTVWMGAIGFLDDYIKVFRKNKEGLQGRLRIVGQVGLGVMVGTVLYFNKNVVQREYDGAQGSKPVMEMVKQKEYQDVKSMKTTVPFFKHNELDYEAVMEMLPFGAKDYTWILYIAVATFLITAISNGANITDGIDGLAAGTSAIIVLALALFAYVSGNVIMADYLDIMYLPNSGELVVFCMAFHGIAFYTDYFQIFKSK